MNETEALGKMLPPGAVKQHKYGGGVIQVLVTSSCDKSCFNCTQASQLARPKWFMSPEHFEQAVLSLRGFHGVTGLFGGNPALSPHFEAYCEILQRHTPFAQRGIWCNNPLTATKAALMMRTFSPAVSNLNCHMDGDAYRLFKSHWPESHPFGLDQDSRHSPPWVAMKDVLRKTCDADGCEEGYVAGKGADGEPEACDYCLGTGQVYDEGRGWELASSCDVNQHWSAGIGVFRGQLRAWFCEVAMAQSLLHHDEPDYPDTGLDPTHLYNEKIWTDDMTVGRELPWWQLPMTAFTRQVRKHCHECGIPLRGWGELAQADRTYPAYDQREQVSETHAAVYRPKRAARRVEVVTRLEQLGVGRIQKATAYLQNAKV